MRDELKQLCEKWKADAEKLSSDFRKLEAAEEVMGHGSLNDAKRAVLIEQSRLNLCIIELQHLLIEAGMKQ